MANEIVVSYFVNVNNGKFKLTEQPDVQQITQNAIGQQAGVLTVATTATNLAFTVATAGVATFTNTDDTHFVQVGDNTSSTFRPVLKLKAGESFVMRLDNSCVLALKADTAAVKVKYNILND